MRLAEKLHGFAQTAQTNYARMMARQDYVTANLCVAKGMQYTMEIIYLLNQKYAPYYKWMRKGMQSLSLIDSVAPILDRIAVIPNQQLRGKDVRIARMRRIIKTRLCPALRILQNIC